MELLLVLAVLAVLVWPLGFGVWTWSRILDAAVARKKSHWQGHVLGAFVGSIFGAFILIGIGLVVTMFGQQHPVGLAVIVVYWGLMAIVLGGILHQTRGRATAMRTSPTAALGKKAG